MNIQEGYEAIRFVGPTNKTIDYSGSNNKSNKTMTF